MCLCVWACRHASMCTCSVKDTDRIRPLLSSDNYSRATSRRKGDCTDSYEQMAERAGMPRMRSHSHLLRSTSLHSPKLFCSLGLGSQPLQSQGTHLPIFSLWEERASCSFCWSKLGEVPDWSGLHPGQLQEPHRGPGLPLDSCDPEVTPCHPHVDQASPPKRKGGPTCSQWEPGAGHPAHFPCFSSSEAGSSVQLQGASLYFHTLLSGKVNFHRMTVGNKREWQHAVKRIAGCVQTLPRV